jgi:hypothetical protein
MSCETGDKSWVNMYDPESHFPYNENPTGALNTASCCLPSTDVTDRWEKIHA